MPFSAAITDVFALTYFEGPTGYCIKQASQSHNLSVDEPLTA
jgi:hypothetical protein